MVARQEPVSRAKAQRQIDAAGRETRVRPEQQSDHGQWPDFDSLIHERIRLGIVSALAVNETLTFNELKKVLNTTDGNLSVHARKLEEASYIRCEKYFEGRMPKTEYRLTAVGRRALEQYLNRMEELIRKTRQ
jgi:DNA-binding HxlR family transcriptional regulator